MFEGVEEDSNIYIRNSSLIKSIMDAGGQNFQLFVQGEKKIKNLAYISGAGKVKEAGWRNDSGYGWMEEVEILCSRAG